MAGEGVYERYKDALKRGHVAAMRGRLDEAIDAYAEASRIAPERATPHTAAGTALLRRKRPADALAYYEAASSLAPRDEAALLGRAQALVAIARRPPGDWVLPPDLSALRSYFFEDRAARVQPLSYRRGLCEIAIRLRDLFPACRIHRHVEVQIVEFVLHGKFLGHRKRTQVVRARFVVLCEKVACSSQI